MIWHRVTRENYELRVQSQIIGTGTLYWELFVFALFYGDILGWDGAVKVLILLFVEYRRNIKMMTDDPPKIVLFKKMCGKFSGSSCLIY